MLDGITKASLIEIYNNLLRLNVAHFSYDAFMNYSRITDVDFCFIFKCGESNYMSFIEKMKTLTPPSQERDRGYKIHSGGIEWNTRHNAEISAPFMKCYDKESEMRKRWGKYLEYYISDENELSRRKRFEFTIKDATHFQSFGINDYSLEKVVDIEQSTRLKMMRSVLRKNLKLNAPYVFNMKSEKDLKPRQKFYLKNLQYMHQNGETRENIIKMVTSTMNKRSRYAYKKELESLYTKFFDGVNIEKSFIGDNPVLGMLMNDEIPSLD